MTEGPVLVTAEPARTAKDAVVPIDTGGWAAEAAGTAITVPRTRRVAAVVTVATVRDQRRRGRVNMTDSFDNPRMTAVDGCVVGSNHYST
jgi:hypothetical protein